MIPACWLGEMLEEDLLVHGRWLRRLARAVAGDAADDVVQDTWLAALRRPPARDRPLRPWLAQVLRNAFRTRERGDRHRAERETRADSAEPPIATDEALARHEELRVLAGAVSALDEPYRTTVILRYSEGLEPSEIA